MADEKMNHEFETTEDDQLGYDTGSDLNNDGKLDDVEEQAAEYGDFANKEDFLDWQRRFHESGLEEFGKQENNTFEDPGLLHQLMEQNAMLAQEMKQAASS